MANGYELVLTELRHEVALPLAAGTPRKLAAQVGDPA